MSHMVFVLGTGRCGSTVVSQILARHPSVGFVSNVEDAFRRADGADRWNNAVYRRVPAALTQKGRLRFAPSEAYRSLAREVSPMLVDPVRDLSAADASPWLTERLRRYFGVRAESQGMPVFLHKFTGWPRIGLLAEVFPDAQFVHIVRDGRAVANSWMQMRWWRGHLGPERWHFGSLPPGYLAEWESSGQRFDLLAGIAWKILLDAFDAGRSDLPADRYLELRYEDVVESPRESYERLLKFCGLTWTHGFEDGFVREPLLNSRVDAFARDLGPEATAILTASLAGHLAARGYPTEPST